MTDNTADQEGLERLHRLGRVDPPDAAVLAAARDSLWLAVTDALLAGAAAPAQPREGRQPTARGRAGQTASENQRRHLPPAAG